MSRKTVATNELIFSENDAPEPWEIIGLFRSAALNGPLDDPERVRQMFEKSQHCVSVRDCSGLLIGVVRTLTDFTFNAFIADLAVHPDYQGQGIGTELLRRSVEPWPGVKFVVHPSGGSLKFYVNRGFSADESVVCGRRTEN